MKTSHMICAKMCWTLSYHSKAALFGNWFDQLFHNLSYTDASWFGCLTVGDAFKNCVIMWAAAAFWLLNWVSQVWAPMPSVPVKEQIER